MSNFNFQNAYVCRLSFIPTSLAAIANVAIDHLSVIGIVKAEGGYECKPDQVVKTSSDKSIVITHKLEVKLEVLSAYAPTSIVQDMDGQLVCLVLVNSDLLPDLETENLSNTYKTLADLLGEAPLPEGVTATVLKPFTAHIEENVKLGSGNVVPFVITAGSNGKVGRTKDELRKLNVSVIDQ